MCISYSSQGHAAEDPFPAKEVGFLNLGYSSDPGVVLVYSIQHLLAMFKHGHVCVQLRAQVYELEPYFLMHSFRTSEL